MKKTRNPENHPASVAGATAGERAGETRSLPDPVLLAVTGMSPAILTETLWALAHESEPVIPGRVVVVTTTEGRRFIREQLFQPSPQLSGCSPWEALRQALTAAGHDLKGRLRFGGTGDDIHVITACDPATGTTQELADLRTREDNDAAADFLLERVRALVENPDTHLITSLAGGRKTMGALLYACMTLIGRETDRLTHVLVSPPFETLRGFWFPAQPGGLITAGAGHEAGTNFDPAGAKVELADVPFVPLRNLFKRELGRGAGTFKLLMESCREQVRRSSGEAVRLTVEQSRCEIEVNGTRVKLAPREHAMLLFLAHRAKTGEPPIGAYAEAIDPINEFCKSLRDSLPDHDISDWRQMLSPKQVFADNEDIRKEVSRIRNKLRRTGGNAHLLIPCLPERGRFSLAVPGPLIWIYEL
jgi:CRISPR-associated protein (TIGR02584 family)